MPDKDRPFAPTRQPFAPGAVERNYGGHFRSQHALTNAFTGFVRKSVEADQHGIHIITAAHLLIDNPRDKLRPGGHEVSPAVKDRTQPHSRPKYNRHSQSG